MKMASGNETEPLFTTSVDSSISYGTRNRDYVSRHSSSRASVLLSVNGRGLIPGIIILFLVLLERIAFYSLTGNLYLFLTQSSFQWTYYNAINALLIFTGTSYLSSLFGGWLSDAYLGRFKTIGFAFIVFTAAYWFLPFMPKICNYVHGEEVSAFVPLYKETCNWSVMSVLIIAAVGTGTVKANITPFGAEQVRYGGPDGLRLYLNWLYWCVNIGALTAILGITYVQQEDGFEIGYIIPASLLSGATLVFWLTYPLYLRQPPYGSSISRIFSVLKDAWKLNRIHKEMRREVHDNNSVAAMNRPSWLDMAKVRFGGKFHESVVEDVKSLSAIIMVFFTLIPYWMLYFQMQTTFLAQGLQMRLSISSSNGTDDSVEKMHFSIPAAWLMLFNVLFLIIFIPVMNHVIYPCLNRRGTQISILMRMGIGMICATLSMVIAGCLEVYRLNFINDHHTVNQTIENTVYVAADLSILWQIPQYSLIGISEVFTSVSGMEFACSQAPSTMQGAVMGLYYFCTGIGSFLGVASLSAFEEIEGLTIGHYVSNINNGGLDYYFFFLAAIQFLTLLVFWYISKKVKIRKHGSPNMSAASLLGSSTRTQ